MNIKNYIPKKVKKYIKQHKKNRINKHKYVPPVDNGEIRLNLGCGDKLLSGYINIDIAPSRKGIKPDKIMDLKHLDYCDNSIDEILSIHVIEHFYYWEAENLVKEWQRVLKNNGRIIIECPNILFAAKMLSKNPKQININKKTDQMTLWPLYGDPSWQDPLMCHKWGYTPDTLKHLLESAGFQGIKKMPALFKKREPRDMRIIAYKKK